jgi:ribonuclease P protein component
VTSGNYRKFPPEHRLRQRYEFLSAWDRGFRFHTDHFIIVVAKNSNGPTRLGVTASKKVGGAVQRNRVKRFIREFFRNNYEKLDSQVDISIIAKKGASTLRYDAACDELKKLLTG